ncbi:aminotransferase class V-fold PLP-dependent enzyme [Jiangella gansuensis]|uniref:aminotransferase class V-fold PLP-dependent enzyme n=1 Tax=Jiangella gansuensis TaxID=281473 RepID=UPI001FDF8CBB|nr:aminotransferase class V-fold PLP-dependent enzyme [Jiangella gansuensis]
MTGPAPQTARIYDDLGIRRVINAADTYTAWGGGRLPDEVVAAMSAAAAHHVDIGALLGAVDRRIALLTGAPAAHVVNGAAAGLAVSVAACITGTDPAAVGLLPDTRGRPSEVVILAAQRNSYDRAVLAAGATLVQVGHADSTPPWAVAAGIGPWTAAALYFAGTEFERCAPPLEDVAAAAHAHDVPVIVDAAAQFPPAGNLTHYLDRGADLVIFSGGKGLRGPQSTGLILGREDLVAACAANSYPHHSVGRSMKSSKENVLGLLAAVERAVKLDWDGEYQRWVDLLAGYQARLAAIPGLRTWIVPTGRLGQTCPRLFLEWPAEAGTTAADLERRLAAGDPAVAIGVDDPRSHRAFVNPYSVLPDEEEHLIAVVVEALRALIEGEK